MSWCSGLTRRSGLASGISERCRDDIAREKVGAVIEVKANITAPALKAMAELASKQVPYATALALTTVAGQARDRVKAQLPGEFKIRRPWTAGGIRIETARKSAWPKITAKVGSIDPYMVDFEAGGPHKLEGTRATGNKTGRTTAFVIPIAIRKAAGLSVSQVIPSRLWPGKLKNGGRVRSRGKKAKPAPFLKTMPDGKTGVFVRTGDFREVSGKRGTHKRAKITMLWAIENRPAKAPKKQWLQRPAQDVVSANLVSEFNKALKKAIASAK